eukprot:2502332-Prymnesium_polylepis.1
MHNVGEIHRVVERRLAAHILVGDAGAKLDCALLQVGAVRQPQQSRGATQDLLVALAKAALQVTQERQRRLRDERHHILVEVGVARLAAPVGDHPIVASQVAKPKPLALRVQLAR